MAWSQQDQSVLVNTNTYSFKDGYVISNPYDSIYDTAGWLWILGDNKLSNEFIYGDKEVVIQRYDGSNFFTIKLPTTPGKKPNGGRFFKHKNNHIYLKLHYAKGRSDLFYIDTETLVFTPVTAYNNLDKKYLISEEFYVNGTTRLAITSSNKLYSTTLDGLSLKFIDSVAFSKPVQEPFIAERRTVNDYTLIKLLFANDGWFLDKKGAIKKTLGSRDFVDAAGKKFIPKFILKEFMHNNTWYYYISDYENVFTYDDKISKFVEVPNTRTDFRTNRELNFVNDYRNAYIQEVAGDYSTFKLFTFSNFKTNLIAEIMVKNASKTIFKEFNKYLVVLSGNTLTTHTFQQSAIKTFLKDKSIRTIKQLGAYDYIVATDSDGFYLINIKENTEKRLKILEDNKEIGINYTRDVYVEKDGSLITVGSEKLFTLDSNYHVIKDRSLPTYGHEIIRIKDTIFTEDNKANFYKYSVRDNKFLKIDNPNSAQIKEFATDGSTIYATSTKGIFEYKNGRINTYSFDNELTENLLSINYLKGYGVLVSTTLGKIYKYDTRAKKLVLFYEDPLRASIVGMEAAGNNLWLNTYVGIVSLDPVTKKAVRYTGKDGVYELEGNRYSTYKDKNGNLFIGSYRGLSFFNPSELSQKELKIQPQFTSISFFNKELDRWEVKTAPAFLKTTKSITLPAEYRRFATTISVLSNISTDGLRYRGRLLNKESSNQWFTSFYGKEILYANLAAGTYRLQIEALDITGNKQGETIELEIIVEDVFYKSWWFIGLVLLSTIAILSFIFYQYKMKQDLLAENKLALNEATIKTTMMLEIHHRIKNNLQIVSGLLGLQMADSDNEELKIKLKDSQHRIESIAGIHNLLYNANKDDSILVSDNVASIIDYYKRLLPITVSYQVDIDDSFLGIDKITPFSLLLNELINNSMKHAFTHTPYPVITIIFKQVKTHYEFNYSDNGTFKKETAVSKTMGMRIIQMMSKQLKGTSTINNDTNFTLKLQFPTNE